MANLYIYAPVSVLCLTGYCFIEVGNDDYTEIYISWTAYVPRFQTEFDFSGILMQVIRALGQLRDNDWELAVYGIVGGVFEIKLSGTEQEVQQGIVFAWFQYSFQVEGIFPIGFSSMDDCRVIGVLLLDAVLTVRAVFYLSVRAEKIEDAVFSPTD